MQSVVLKLIVDREKSIRDFVSEEYWDINAQLSKLNDSKAFKSSLTHYNNKKIEIANEAEARRVENELNNSIFLVDSVKRNVVEGKTPAPYITSSLQQDAIKKLKMTLNSYTKAAQSLYEGVEIEGEGKVALVTYIRTDSVRISPDAQNMAKQYIIENFGENYAPKKFNVYGGKKNVQDAHEGIRPTDLSITPELVEEKGSKEQAKLYKLIYKRAVASMMKDEIYDRYDVYFSCGDYNLLASAEKRVFDGFVKELGKLDKVERTPFPCKIEKTSVITETNFSAKESKSKGPTPYNEASLILTMKKEGIGRPSTYATTIDLIKVREYVSVNKTYFSPTEQGKLTAHKLESSFADIINVDYTAQMETKLDEIAEGKLTRLEALSDFYNKFSELYKKAKVDMIKEEPIKEDYGLCPQCGMPLVKRVSRFGSFLACSGFPNCKFIYNDNRSGQECPKCKKGKLVLRSSKYGKFYACNCFPKCDYHESIKEPGK